MNWLILILITIVFYFNYNNMEHLHVPGSSNRSYVGNNYGYGRIKSDNELYFMDLTQQ